MARPVLLDVENQIAVITLNRPERRNAINQQLLIRLYDALDAVTVRDDVRVIIITGNGPSFCAGLDLGAIGKENLFDPRGNGSDLPDLMRACNKPIIAAVNGHAITGGFELALNCDFIIAAENAQFSDTHVRVGIHPGWGMTQLLQQTVGQRRAKQISFACQPIYAHTALAWGLVNEVLPREHLLDRAKTIAAQIVKADPQLLGVIKTLIENRNRSPLEQAFDQERSGFKQFLRDQISKFKS
ncbi:enoyl-CoA hydratase [Desulfosarcina sp.]|uniref:enoyl-CoA hydratase n=1 Tax=Desulfosarcina sp. TaxID=2027861 RepID=UPI0029A7A7E6|nr:enoyl-CoA hydratase [Desulfosarcina sp.]MDX2454734.1 enoyl-CoA hydratase [Desulfosarcina sp.]MDX2492347.1 enoyl-CoA hydratase [Desulfosarcina sp.]